MKWRNNSCGTGTLHEAEKFDRLYNESEREASRYIVLCLMKTSVYESYFSFLGTKYTIKIRASIESKIWVCVYDVII